MTLPIYLDNHATTPLDPRVLEAMLPFLREDFGNAASINHAYGWRAAEAVEQARARVATLLEVPATCVIFTSGATEANNLAIKGMLDAPRGGHLIVTAAEHRSVLDPAKRIKRRGGEVTVLPVDATGSVDPQRVADALRPETKLVSVIHASNEVGTINPIAEIGALCADRGAAFHTDAVQSVGKIVGGRRATGQTLASSATTAQSVGKVAGGFRDVPLVSLSAHKIYGPKGVGALIVNPQAARLRLTPQIEGGGHEQHLRSGTLPVANIVGFGRACELAGESWEEDAARIRNLRDRLWSGLQSRLDGLRRNGDAGNCLPGNLNVSVEGVDGDALMTGMRRIAVSSGSACTTAEPEPSHVLRAMGVRDDLTRASLRFGIGRFNTEGEIEIAIEHVAEVVERLR